MRVYNGLAGIDPPLSGATLTIGNFDGVHRGHQLILAQACLTASRLGGEAVVMTFDPHPLAVLNPSRAPTPLTSIDERMRLIAACGVRCAVVVPCTKELLSLTAEKFFEQVVVPHFRPKSLVEGASWRFGQRRSGDLETLAALGRRFGFEVTAVPSMTMEVDPGQDVLVSSSLIRDFIGQHQVERAAACLGRPYALVGRVVPGQRRGAKMGFPTANVKVLGQLVPPSGVYAGQACLGDRQQPAAISIGRAPTFGGGELTVEAYILDFDGELYGQSIRLEFCRWLRPQRAFDSVEALREQIDHDVQVVRQRVDPSE
ncbi:MAG TPA: bifunctional riboflavin kinase/FAD synthetase [Phycisphaerae bacterium]|nr:bifunctional riboflavin kinase/FAD synthetase [Phycisphaerae bacterium]